MFAFWIHTGVDISSVSGMGVYCSDLPQESLLGGKELADSLQPRHLWNLQQWLYHSHAFPVLLPVDDCRCGRAKPSCCSNVQCLLCSSPLAQLRLSQSLHWSLRLLLPHPPSFHLSFHRCQNCITDWGAPTFPYLLLPSLSRLSFTGVSLNKSLALLGPSLHLLPGGSKQIL